MNILADASIPDALTPNADAATIDASTIDAGVEDASVPDAALPDAPTPDAPVPDAPIADAGIPDAPPPDAPTPDAAPPTEPTWTTLSETGLYSDIVNKTIAPNIIEYSPAYQLWSDGAHKTRWIYLPPGTQIDTSNMDDWKLPVGTKVWKLFVDDSVMPEVLLETRVIYRWGPNPDDVWMGSFIWNSGGTDADYADAGGMNVNGTDHDVPPSWECISCHGGASDRLLGFSAVQLSHSNTVNLTSLANDGWLSNPPPMGTQYPVPGNATESAAIGYLHANCGHCHGQQPNMLSCGDISGLQLRVFSTDTDVNMTDAYQSAVNQLLSNAVWTPPMGVTHRVKPMDIGASGVHFRMNTRGSSDQMPPDFTEIVDVVGVQAVADWISALPLP